MAILELDQSFETPLTEYQRGPFKLRYAYARSKDCRDSGERGQDYLVWRAETHRTGFALCDGVGQSFLGGLGSQIVGETLIDWLWRLPTDRAVRSVDLNTVAKQLRMVLDAKKESATRIIREKDISSVESDMIREALESRREKKGTQSNFVCGIVDVPSEHLPSGLVRLFWLGDAKLQIWQKGNNRSSQLHADWSKHEAWSSKLGTSGEIHCFQGTFDDLDCIIAHSDGVDPIQSKLSPMLSSSVLDQGLKTLGDDDSSFLELSVGNSSIDVEDDLVSSVRESPNVPVQIIKQIIKQIEVAKEQPVDRIVEVSRIPRYVWILFPILVVFASAISYVLGWMTGPVSPPLVSSTNTPVLFGTAPPLPTSTSLFIETETATPAPMTLIGAFLYSSDVPPAQLNQSVCTNILDMPAFYQQPSHFEVHGAYVLKGFNRRDCQGDLVIRLEDGGTHPLGPGIWSVSVDSAPSLSPQ